VIVEKKGLFSTINVISVVIPVVVAVLLGIRTKLDLGAWTQSLPLINAVINSATAVLLVIGLFLIKSKNIASHKLAMSLAFALGGLFLVFYVIYHISNPSTSFGGVGLIRYFYYFNLISHIGASLIVLPFVLRAYYFGWNRMDAEHRKVVKIAYPIWLYVSITGVLAYIMISPYYSF
jgi:putative membrane protein